MGSMAISRSAVRWSVAPLLAPSRSSLASSCTSRSCIVPFAAPLSARLDTSQWRLAFQFLGDPIGASSFVSPVQLNAAQQITLAPSSQRNAHVPPKIEAAGWTRKGGKSAGGSGGKTAKPKAKSWKERHEKFVKPFILDVYISKRYGRYKQRVLNFARPGGPTQPAPSVETRPVAPEPAAKVFEDPKGKQLSVEELQLKCKEQWQRYFPWLFISETKDGRPCMRCSICMVFADPHSKYGRYGVGGIDIQKQTMRKHHHSRKHEAAVREKEQRDGAKKGQKSIVDFHQGDEDVKRLARLMSIVLFICKSDAPIVLFVSLVQFMAEQGTPDMPLKENGTYYSEEALAAKDAAIKHPDLNIVDKVVRSVAENLGRSSVVHSRFLELQEVICETNLEVQGIKDVRWLSRGQAIGRLVNVFPAAVFVLHEFDKKMYKVITSYKFQFMLFLLADVLKELNNLSLKFQRRQVDATHVLPMVHNTTLLLRTRYLDIDDDSFGQGGDALGPFLKKHASRESREVKVAGKAADGTSSDLTYTLHEDPIKGQKGGVDHGACLELARAFVTTLIGRLDYRLKDLANLDGAKLFKQGSYPKNQAKRERKLGQWLQSLRNMFKKKPEDPDTLPGT
ncbi:unnamed protein product [Closterium sp. Naga37s-1]|nr:unnamed protein product [Closterium sp. Naga37s-1]